MAEPKSKKKKASSKASKAPPPPPKKKAAAAKRSSSSAKGATRDYTFDDDITVTASNVDRVVFKEAGITKGDILDYYRDIASEMVPELRGRPLTLERFTQGIGGGGFFQKHFQKHFPDWIDRVEMGVKTKVVYAVCNEPASLVYLANQGSISFHIGTSRKDNPDNPDEVVFDLDPPEGEFELARKAAHAVHEFLEQLELTAFLKTTGSKGLHLVVPLDGSNTYAEVGAFCKLAAKHLAAQHDDLLTTEFYKKDRDGRLFLDIMRNTGGATVVAPWSVRGRPNAPVSAPITWDELDDPALKANSITLRDVRERLEQHGNPWADFRAYEAGLSKALAELGE